MDLIEYPKDYKSKIKLKSPEKLQQLIKQVSIKTRSLDSSLNEIIPDILVNLNLANSNKIVKIYYGKDRFEELFVKVLQLCKHRGTILDFGDGEDFLDVIDLSFCNSVWTNNRIEKKITAKILSTYNSRYWREQSKITNNKNLREVRFLPQSINHPGSFWVFDDNLILWNTTEPVALHIKNTIMSNFFKIIFLDYWNNCY